jgi:hypothetical protein
VVILRHISESYTFRYELSLNFFGLNEFYVLPRYTRWRSCLRHCATSRKVTASIPDGVIGVFHRRNPSGRTMALGSTQLLT